MKLIRGGFVTGAYLRKPERGDLDRINESEPFRLRTAYDWDDLPSIVAGPPRPQQAGTHRDCPACTCQRDRHHGWGCPCGCALPIALITPIDVTALPGRA